MSAHRLCAGNLDGLAAAGLSSGAITSWAESAPHHSTDYEKDRRSYSAFWLQSAQLASLLPAPVRRNDVQRSAAALIAEEARAARVQFLRDHVEAVYDALTGACSRFIRVEKLVTAAADQVPGLVPGPDELAAENGRLQRERGGLEIDQGLFVSAVLANQRTGRHLCHAMLLPRPEANELVARYEREGAIDFDGASVRRRGKASVVTYEHPRFLNAEDQGTLDAAEICVDLALLDRDSEIAVLRGGSVDHPKYGGRRVFGAGINLTHLYHGRIPYVWYLQRDLGYVNKIYRGLAFTDDLPPDECGGATIEKPWIAAVEGFAIGGHCQVLLVCDYVLAARNAYLTLPARKEGIIPGAANLRLPRFTGDRIAREAILYDRRIDCDSAQGRMLCDELIEPDNIDEAIDQVVAGMTSSGVVSAAGNRRAIRIGQEPFDTFRSYMAVYAREQAYCHFSPALITNLERHWNAANRRA